MHPTSLVVGETRSFTGQQQLKSGQQQRDGANHPLVVFFFF